MCLLFWGWLGTYIHVGEESVGGVMGLCAGHGGIGYVSRMVEILSRLLRVLCASVHEDGDGDGIVCGISMKDDIATWTGECNNGLYGVVACAIDAALFSLIRMR